jgi:hypothetical protein
MQSSSYWKFAGVFLAIIILAGGGYFVWDRFFSEAGKYRRMFAEQERVYKEAEQKYIAAMTADTYGGKTPQETLDMFVSALRAGDVELASKYFLLDENASRERWLKRIIEIKGRGLLEVMASDIQRAVPDPEGPLYEGNYGFVIYTNGGVVGAEIDMQFNKYSQIWKIESF